VNDKFLSEFSQNSRRANGRGHQTQQGRRVPSTSSSGLPTREALRKERRKREQERRRKRRRRISRFFVLLLALGLVGGAAWFVVIPVFQGDGFSLFGGTELVAAENDYPGPGSGLVEVTITRGDTSDEIGDKLVEAGVVKSQGAFRTASSNDPARAARIQPGIYEMKQEMPAEDALISLLDPSTRIEVKVTIQEGLRASQVFEKLSSVTDVTIEELEEVADDPKAIGLPKVADGNVEGWLFPATYTFDPGATGEEMLSELVEQTITVLNDLDVKKKDREKVLNKASIVEREGISDEDFGKIARVINNRLAADMTLGMDSTIAYGLDKSGLDLTRDDLESDNKFNTRVHTGLPPSPIGSPGERAIAAVVDPPAGDWLFFVTTNPDEGVTKFTDSYEEHNEFKKEYEEWFEKRQQEEE